MAAKQLSAFPFYLKPLIPWLPQAPPLNIGIFLLGFRPLKLYP